jgi:SAM-dependent methyltransferase
MQETTLFGGLVADEAGTRLGQLVDGFIATQVVAVTARLGVYDHLTEGAQTAEELAVATGTEPGALGRLLRAAAALGLLTQNEEERCALTEIGELLRTDAAGSLRDLVVGFTAAPFWRSIGQLEDVVQTGQPASVDDAGNGIWEYFRHHPDEARWVTRAMSTITSRLAAEVAAGYNPSGFDRIVDVGGGKGTLLARLLRNAPQATGVLFDLSEALVEAPAVLADNGVAERTEVVAGSFLQEVPAEGDLYLISQVLHNWDDERARTIVGNCHRASRPHGTLLVIEPLLPSGSQPSPLHLLDLITLVAAGGRERTREQLESLLASEGYTLMRDIPLSQDFLPWHILECRRT